MRCTNVRELGPKKYQKIARMYDRTGLSTKCTLIKNGFKNARTGTKVFRTGFYKGTFRDQTGTIVHSRNFLVLFRP